MADAERYVSVNELMDEIAFDESMFDVVNWDPFLERLLGAESERIENAAYAGRVWAPHPDAPDDNDVPAVVKHGVIRLVRSRLEQIHSDGLSSESGPAGQSLDYRPPAHVRQDVQSMVSKYREPTDDDADRGAWVV